MMVHPETGEELSRDIRPFAARYEGRTRRVDLPGWYPARKGGESIHVGDDLAVVDLVLAELKAEHHASIH